jgi:hypothetical protein
MNPPSHAKTRAAEALAALAARGAAQGDDLPTSIQDLVCDLGHLSDDNNLDFVAILTRALRHWQVERIDPASVAEGPVVEIYIGAEGLPPKPKPAKRPNKHKKSRPA